MIRYCHTLNAKTKNILDQRWPCSFRDYSHVCVYTESYTIPITFVKMLEIVLKANKIYFKYITRIDVVNLCRIHCQKQIRVLALFISRCKYKAGNRNTYP